MSYSDLPKAYIKHQIAGRVRLKIPTKRGNEPYFETLAEKFAECETITQLQINAATASLLIQHEPSSPFLEVAQFASDASLFKITAENDSERPSTDQSSLASLSSLAASTLDHKLADLSAGRIDMRSLLFLSFIGLSIHEATKGHVMAPASTFLWRALQLLNQKNDNFFE